MNTIKSGDWKPIMETSAEEAANHIACPYLAAFNVIKDETDLR
jgi:hypothetical protein